MSERPDLEYLRSSFGWGGEPVWQYSADQVQLACDYIDELEREVERKTGALKEILAIHEGWPREPGLEEPMDYPERGDTTRQIVRNALSEQLEKRW